eukprot:COSAG04_NODE_1200_length_7773_cov_5.364999_8_plen_125_part_00
MIPILHSSGQIIPGQFGPIRRVLLVVASMRFTFTMSCCGIPSVMQTTRGISASIASIIAKPATGGGTKITDASAPVVSFACCRDARSVRQHFAYTLQDTCGGTCWGETGLTSCTEPNTGRPRCS